MTIKKQKGSLWTDNNGTQVEMKRITPKEKYDEEKATILGNLAVKIEKELKELYKLSVEYCEKSYLLFLKEKTTKELFEKEKQKASDAGYTWYNFDKSVKIVRIVQPITEWDGNLMQLALTKFDQFFNTTVPESVMFLKQMITDALGSTRSNKFDSRKINTVLSHKNNEALLTNELFQSAIATLEEAKINSERKRVYYQFYLLKEDKTDYIQINLNFSYL